MQKKWVVKKKYFFVLLVGVSFVRTHASANIVPMMERRCIDIFTVKKKPHSASVVMSELIDFSGQIPEFQEAPEFLMEMEKNVDGVEYFYNSTNDRAPISKYVAGSWSSEPYLALSKNIFILKAVRIPRFRQRSLEGRIQRIEELRADFRLVAYTRVSVPPIFSLLNRGIYIVRGLQSHTTGQEYLNVALNYHPVIRGGALVPRLYEFINSWEPRDEVEVIVREHFLGIVRHHYDDTKGEPSMASIASEIEMALTYLYPPEFFSSLMDSIYTF
jgi:hypothetical protein